MHFSLTWFMFLVIVHSYNVRAIEESKCVQPHRVAYDTCSLDYETMALWCDSTNFTNVPHYESSRIETLTPAQNAKRIQLNSSCVSELTPIRLGYYKHLTALDCDDNEITNIPTGLFRANIKLEELTLSNNRIAKLGWKTFTGLNKLSILNLRGNRLSRISATDFDQLTRLRTLDLSQNKIKYINRNAFQSMGNLKVLRLDENYLTKISELHFDGLIELRTLNLAGNQLKTLDGGLFQSSRMILSVDVSNNRLACMSKALFKENSEISVFRINNNNVTTPKPEWFRTLWSNRRRDLIDGNLLTNNPWSCGCDSFKYWSFFLHEVANEDRREMLDVECYTPPDLRGRKISSLHVNVFMQCPVSSYDGECGENTSDVVNDSNVSGILNKDEGVIDKQDETAKDQTLPVVLVKMSATYPPRLNGKDTFNTEDKFDNKLVVLFVVLLILVVCACVIICIWMRKQKKKKSEQRKQMQNEEQTQETHLHFLVVAQNVQLNAG